MGKVGTATTYEKIPLDLKEELRERGISYLEYLKQQNSPKCGVCKEPVAYAKKWCLPCTREIIDLKDDYPTLTISQLSKKAKSRRKRQTSLD